MSQVTAEQLKAVTMKYAENFNMSNWAVSEEYYEERKENMTVVEKLGECGTSCCLAGNACLIAGDKLVIIDDELRSIAEDGTHDWIPDRASELLDLNYGYNGNEIHPMFEHSRWPGHLEAAYRSADSDEERAQVACEAVDYYMGGKR